MRPPKLVTAAEAAQSQEVIDAGLAVHAAMLDATKTDAEVDAMVAAYNAMPNAVEKITRAQYRAAYGLI
jgi:hypothetical protein